MAASVDESERVLGHEGKGEGTGKRLEARSGAEAGGAESASGTASPSSACWLLVRRREAAGGKSGVDDPGAGS
eukprot:6211097-Pleurochrysis_carterae.AAC.4